MFKNDFITNLAWNKVGPQVILQVLTVQRYKDRTEVNLYCLEYKWRELKSKKKEKQIKANLQVNKTKQNKTDDFIISTPLIYA